MEGKVQYLGVAPEYNDAPQEQPSAMPQQQDNGVQYLGIAPEFESAPQEQQQPSTVSEIARHGVRSVARLAEGLGSGVSAIPKLLATGVDYIAGTKTGDYIPDFGEKIKKYVSEPLLGGLQKPQGKIEGGVDEFIETFGSFLSPGSIIGKAGKVLGVASKAGKALTTGGKILKAGKTIAKTAALAGADKIADWGTKAIDLPDKYAMPIRLGAVLGTSYLANTGALGKVKGSYYKEANELLANSAVKANKLPGFTKKLGGIIEKHGSKLSDGSINTGTLLLSGAKAELNEVISLQKELNQIRFGKAGLGLTDAARLEVGNTAGKLAKDLEKIAGGKNVSSGMQQGLDRFLTAEQLHQAENMNKNISKNIGKAVGSVTDKKGGESMFGNLGSLVGIFKFPGVYIPYKALKGVAKGAYSTVKAPIEFAKKIQKFPKIRSAYYEVLKNAANDGGTGAIVNSLAKLDKLL